MGTRLEAGDGPPIEIPAPRPRFGRPYWPHFLEKHEKTGDFEYKPGIFFDSAISQEVGVGSTKLKQVYTLYHPQTLVR